MLSFAATLFLWVELIGFDNTRPDFGVGEYLGRMDFRPDAISFMLDDDRMLQCYRGYDAAAELKPGNCAYGARPYNGERLRQKWTQGQMKALVSELRKRGVAVYASFFHWYPEVFPKPDAEAESLGRRLVKFITDFGFDGFHGADGWAPPRFLLEKCEDGKRAAVARKRAERYAANWKTLATMLKAEGKKVWINTCWTLDPYEALYRYGVDYRLLAKTGIDGFVVESSAAAKELFGRRYTKAPTIDKSVAMVMRLKAACPEMPMVMLHAINDGNEVWSALRHAPTLTRSEALAMGTAFCNGRRCLDGFLACLADGLKADEWRELNKTWQQAMTAAKGPLGARVVWSDAAFDREFDDCTVSHDASSFTLLYELLAHGAPVNAIVSSEEALRDDSYPIVLLNPEFIPEKELAALRDRPERVLELGRGARARSPVEYVKCETPKPFPGMPDDDVCYFTRPLCENLPKDAFIRQEADATREMVPYSCGAGDTHTWGFRLADGRLAVLVRNNAHTYVDALVKLNECVSDVRVLGDFPSCPVRTSLSGRIAPQDTMFLSVGEHPWELPTGR